MKTGSIFAGALIAAAAVLLVPLVTYAVPPGGQRSTLRFPVPMAASVAVAPTIEASVVRRLRVPAQLAQDLAPANAGRIRNWPANAAE